VNVVATNSPDYEAFFNRCISDISVGTGSQRYGLCPLHPDTHRSFSFNIETGLWTCHGGCGPGHASALAVRLNLPAEDIIALKPGRQSKQIEAVYDYKDEDGQLLYQAVRYHPKEFRQRRPDGKSGWVWNLKDTRRVIYRLPDTLAAIKQAVTVFVSEGEKDVENLWKHGLAATCNPQGAGKWREEYSGALTGGTVVILADNDDVGRDHAQQVARSLRGKAKSIKIVELPNLPPKGDVSDWLAAGGTADALKQIVENTQEWQSPAAEQKPQQASAELPEIDIRVKDLKSLTQQTWDAICAANKPPTIFRYGGFATRIERSDEGVLILRDLNADRMKHLIARVAQCGNRIEDSKTREVYFIPAFPPNEVVRDILATPDKPLPLITRIVEIPIFGPDLSLQITPGYYPVSRTYYSPTQGLVIPPVPLAPTKAEVERARRMILEDLLSDFPFTSQSEIAHSVALLLLPFIREVIDGPTPLHLIEAPTAGTGKGLLTWALTYLFIGNFVALMTEGRDEDEWRKRITAKLRRGPSVIIIDNLRRRLDSAAVASALTSLVWEDRLLGQSETLNLPIRATWIVNGNNPALSAEMSRRAVRIRLDSKHDRPWLRTKFRHPNLMQWVKSSRGELIAAVLTLIQAWVAAGHPKSSGPTLGTYESWSDVIGGILDVIEIPGFLGNLEEVYEASDAEGSVWRGLTRAWWEAHGDREVGVSELWEIALRLDEPLDLGNGSEKSQKTRFGKELVAARDRQFDGLRIVLAGTYKRAKVWRLAPTGEHGEPGEHVQTASAATVPGFDVRVVQPSSPDLPFAGSPVPSPERKPTFFKDVLAQDPVLRAHVASLVGGGNAPAASSADPEPDRHLESESVPADKKGPLWPQ
jgi:5S rRNA maturation endonuclease (ribonuclease M5)